MTALRAATNEITTPRSLKRGGGRPAVAPADEKSFGYALWLVLGGARANLTDAAKPLGTVRSTLSDIIHGKRQITRRELDQKKWTGTLQRLSPQGWAKWGALYEVRAQSLPPAPPEKIKKPKAPPRSRARIIPPEQKDAMFADSFFAREEAAYENFLSDATAIDTRPFGFILWQIVGGRAANRIAAAQRLDTPQQRFNGILRGTYRVSQQEIADKGWCEILAEAHPDGWERHGAALLTALETLPPWATNAGASKAPDDRDSVCYVLWRIIGGTEANQRLAARNLGIDHREFHNILYGHPFMLTQQDLANGQWREKLATHYPDGWREHRPAFEKQAAALLDKDEIEHSAAEIEEAWRHAIGDFIRDRLDEEREEIGDIMSTPHIARVLKNEQIWGRVIDADTDLPLSIYRDARIATCRCYGIADDPDYYVEGFRPYGVYAETARERLDS